MTRIFGALLLVSAALILTSCKDDEPGIPESVVRCSYFGYQSDCLDRFGDCAGRPLQN